MQAGNPSPYDTGSTRPESRSPSREEKQVIGIVIALATVALCAFVVLAFGAITYITQNPRALVLFPSATPLPTPTPPNPQLSPGKILSWNSFDKENEWSTGVVGRDWAVIDRQIVDGKYRWDVVAREDFFSFANPGAGIFLPEDFYQVSLDTRVINGPGDAAFGMVFAYTGPDDYWTWLVTEDGIGLLCHLEDGNWSDPPEWQMENLPVKRGETNTLTMKVSPDRVSLYLNGLRVGSYAGEAGKNTFINSDYPKAGVPGVAIEIWEAGDRATFEFDNLVVSKPDTFDE